MRAHQVHHKLFTTACSVGRQISTHACSQHCSKLTFCSGRCRRESDAATDSEEGGGGAAEEVETTADRDGNSSCTGADPPVCHRGL